MCCCCFFFKVSFMSFSIKESLVTLWCHCELGYWFQQHSVVLFFFPLLDGTRYSNPAWWVPLPRTGTRPSSWSFASSSSFWLVSTKWRHWLKREQVKDFRLLFSLFNVERSEWFVLNKALLMIYTGFREQD